MPRRLALRPRPPAAVVGPSFDRLAKRSPIRNALASSAGHGNVKFTFVVLFAVILIFLVTVPLSGFLNVSL